jgi:RimJ/RimL family protein N-acetyltransferase
MQTSDNIILTCNENNDYKIILRSISVGDLDDLMRWKNKHRESFFYKSIINSEQQLKWYYSFVERKNDYMFIIENSNNKFGCMGFRKIEDFIDIYNVILGDDNYKGKGIMTFALNMLTQYISDHYEGSGITAKVLNTNVALTWYIKNGFSVLKKHEDYSLIKLTHHQNISLVQINKR